MTGATPVISFKLPSNVLENSLGCDLLPVKSGKYENSIENDCKSLATGSVSFGQEGTATVSA